MKVFTDAAINVWVVWPSWANTWCENGLPPNQRWQRRRSRPGCTALPRDYSRNGSGCCSGCQLILRQPRRSLLPRGSGGCVIWRIEGYLEPAFGERWLEHSKKNDC